MYKHFVLISLLCICLSASAGEVSYLTTEQFREQIFDYKHEKEWKYKGSLPCVIDFYTSWCGPCKRLAPIMEELSCIYSDEVVFYKADTDRERELAAIFGINAIPQVLYIPTEGRPLLLQGLYPRDNIVEIIDNFLLKKQK